MTDFKCYLDAFCEENDLAVSISYEMPAGYETAYGTYDVTINTIFINRALIQNSPAYEALYFAPCGHCYLRCRIPGFQIHE